MNYIVTPFEMQQAEEQAFSKGLSPYDAMKKAGTYVFEEAKKFKKVLVVCFSGNNGGDGFVCAKMLNEVGISVHVLFIGNEEKLSPHAKRFYDDVSELLIKTPNNDYDCIVDAIFGIGFKGALTGAVSDAVNLINSFKDRATVISVDIPSGLNGLTGEAECAVNADVTVTFGAKKLGHIINKGAEFTGQIKACDIGIYPKTSVFEPKRPILPALTPTAHKGSMGHAGFICGSFGMEGAAIMSTSAAIKSSLGKVSLAVSEDIKNNFTNRSPEIMLTLRNDVTDFIKNKDVVVFGCGIGRNEDNPVLLKEILKNCLCPLIIDADGLYFLTAEFLKKAKCPIILTPHIAEASRLMNCDISSLIASPQTYIRDFYEKTGATVLLKSNYNMFACRDGIYLSSYGCKGMATAGSGDVLAGILAGTIHLTKDITKGALLASYIHGTAGNFAQKEKTAYAMTASDIIENIPNAFKTLI